MIAVGPNVMSDRKASCSFAARIRY